MSTSSTPAPDPLDRPASGEPDEPLGDDPRPGNVGRAAEAPVAEEHHDPLDQASDESFPASDPPSWSGAPTVGDAQPDIDAPGGRHGLGRLVDEGGAEGDGSHGDDGG